jgi:hypothetical protein
MKTLKYFFGISVLFALTAPGVNAQTPNQTVTQGSVHHYHVTDHSPNYTYAWTFVEVTTNTIANPAAVATNVTWSQPGQYTLTLTETNSTGGCNTSNTFIVLVLGQPGLQFASATSADCPDQAMNLALNFTTTTGTAITSADVSYFPLTVNYTVNGNARTVTFAAGDALFIPLTAADRADQPTYANYTIPVVITGATSNNGAVTIGAISTNTNTVYDKPNTNAIVAD